MRCSDLCDLADSWLSDDSSITSNREALEHLEHCDDCLRAIVDRRNLRAMLRTAIMDAPASQIDDDFASHLRARLRTVLS
jgi:hypothetical protein